MDLWSVHVKCNNPSPIFFARTFNHNKISPFYYNYNKCFYNKSYGSFVVKAMGNKKNSGNSSSGNGDRTGSNSKGSNPSNGKKSNKNGGQRSHNVSPDWREFRAALVAREEAEAADSSSVGTDGSKSESKPLGLNWAHPISTFETGSVLVATEVLDGEYHFERTVVLLLWSGTRRFGAGPYGVIINRPLHEKVKHMKTTDLEMATTFADCSLHSGGPMKSRLVFLLRSLENSKLPGFEEVIPGLFFGDSNNLEEAMALVKKGVVKPQDFRFFLGYAGWEDMDQLERELRQNYWHVAACSTNLIYGGATKSSEGLWEEILQLMGGQYSELSRKPKQDM